MAFVISWPRAENGVEKQTVSEMVFVPTLLPNVVDRSLLSYVAQVSYGGLMDGQMSRSVGVWPSSPQPDDEVFPLDGVECNWVCVRLFRRTFCRTSA